MAGADTAGTILAPVAGAAVAIVVALVLPPEIAVLGSVPLLVGVAIGAVVTFGLGYAVGDRGYLMIGGPVLHILVGGVAAAGVVGSRLSGFAVAGVGGVGLLLFVARVRTGNLRRHAAVPANPSTIRKTEAAVAKRLLWFRSGVRRIASRFPGRIALGVVWIAATTGLLWSTAAVAAGAVPASGAVPARTLSMVPASGYLVALFAPFFVWTDWLGLEGIDQEMRTRIRASQSPGNATETGEAESDGETTEPAESTPPAPTGESSQAPESPEPTDASGSVDSTASADTAEATETADPAASTDPPDVAEASDAGSADERVESPDAAAEGADTGAGDDADNEDDRTSEGGFIDADPEELWSPGFGDSGGTDRNAEIQIPGLDEDDDGDELWGSVTDAEPESADASSPGAEPPGSFAGDDADDDGRSESPAGDEPIPDDAGDQSDAPGPGEPPSTGESPGPAPGPVENDADENTRKPGDRVRSYQPGGGHSDGEDTIPIYGPEDDEESAEDGSEDVDPGDPVDFDAGDGEAELDDWVNPDPQTSGGSASEPTADRPGHSDDEGAAETDEGPAEQPDGETVAGESAEQPDEGSVPEDAGEQPSEGSTPADAQAPPVETGAESPAESEVESSTPDEAAAGSPGDGEEKEGTESEGEAVEARGGSVESEKAETAESDDEEPVDGNQSEIEDESVESENGGIAEHDDEETGDDGTAEGDEEAVAEPRPTGNRSTDPGDRSVSTAESDAGNEGGVAGDSGPVPEPTRPPVDTDAADAATDDHDSTPSVSRGRPVGIRGIDAGRDGDSTDRTRASRGNAPRRVGDPEDPVLRDGSPAPDEDRRPGPPTSTTDPDEADGSTDETRTTPADVSTEGGPGDDTSGDDETVVTDGATTEGAEGRDGGVLDVDDDRSVSEITESIEDDLEQIISEEEPRRPPEQRPGTPGEQSGVSDRVSAILSGEADAEEAPIDQGTAEEIADILAADEDDEDEDEDE